MQAKKLNRETLVEQVAAQMERLIQSGRWRVEEKIPPEPELTLAFGVGRNTLREAVKGLVHAGMLEARRGVGTIVKADDRLRAVLERKIRDSDLLEAFEVRLCMEREAALLAARRRTAADLNMMKRHLDVCADASEKADPRAFAAADMLFHKTVVEAAHNSMFRDLYASIFDTLQKSVTAIVETRDAEYLVHRDLLDAIRDRNAPMALEAANRYLGKALATMQILLKGKKT